MSGFSVSGAAGGLPAGWSGPGTGTFTCDSVATGSGCVLNLQYAPTAPDSGTFIVNYVVIDDAGLAKTNGSAAIAYAATAGNNVVAAASPSGEVDAVMDGGPVAVSVNFVTDDGNPATNLVLTSDLTALPAGWSSTAPALSCPLVSTGSGCRLVLNYGPVTTASGTLTLNYRFTDDSGASKTGSLNIPYRSKTSNDVIASLSPTGQVTAVQKTGGQAVAVDFTTDDGRTASRLAVTTDLTRLPPGWSSAVHGFACAGVSTGNGCRLTLNYAPTALASGVLPLNYTYVDGDGQARSGMLNVGYCATTNDNIVGTASPAGQVNAVVGMGSQALAVTFTSDDGRPTTALQIVSDLTVLPPGWSSSASAFACSALDADAPCVLPLTYSPTVAGSGTLGLQYAYTNNAGVPKTGSVDIAFRATTNDSVVGTPSPSSLLVAPGSSTAVTVTFTTDDGNPASGLLLTTDLASLPAGWSSSAPGLTCALVNVGNGCTLALTYAPLAGDVGALVLTFAYTNDAGIAKIGTATISYMATTPM
jgi:hypothetical protein